MIHGHYGEFKVLVDDQIVADVNKLGFPPAARKILADVRLGWLEQIRAVNPPLQSRESHQLGQAFQPFAKTGCDPRMDTSNLSNSAESTGHFSAAGH